MGLPKFTLKKILILVTILAVPGFLYYLLQEKGKNRYRPLEIFGPKKVAETFHSKRGRQIPDTIYHTIRDFKLTNQANQTVSFPTDSNRITVVNFFFTRCPSFCTNMNSEMARVAKVYEQNKMIRLMSVTVDPQHDTPQVLKEYAATYQAKIPKWQFLTGDKTLVYQLAKQDFLLDALKDTTQEINFIHSPMLVLVDPQKRIRGFYDSASRKQVDTLIDEIKVLITEELRKVK